MRESMRGAATTVILGTLNCKFSLTKNSVKMYKNRVNTVEQSKIIQNKIFICKKVTSVIGVYKSPPLYILYKFSFINRLL